MKQTWRAYQAQLKREAQKKKLHRLALLILVVPILMTLAIFGVGDIFIPLRHMITAMGMIHSAPGEETDSGVFDPVMGKSEIQRLLHNNPLINLTDSRIAIRHNDRIFQMDTSLDVSIQQFILTKLDRTNSKYIGIVAMEPTTGRVLAMVGFDRESPGNNPCINNRFPAASIFKIVTAAAGIEKFGFTPNTVFTYNGGKYTLYKSQLKKTNNVYSQHITFKDSFAQSVNPVFGQIGALYLKKTTLERYATAFGFNRTIDFEVPIAPSRLHITDEPYHWAEVSSGFNRETLLSPLHGALLSSAVLNSGNLPEPTLIDRITDDRGQTVYLSPTTRSIRACTPKATEMLKLMMSETIRSGTCRDAFKGYRKDPVFSKLNVGGKSGSIASRQHDVRFDWFVGFAEEKQGKEKLAVAVVVGHGNYIGTRASRYARMMIKKYFDDYFAGNEEKSSKYIIGS